MASPISYAKIELSCPLFDAVFDPYNRGYLLVGGGGGENRTGVANTLALLDVSDRSEVKKAAEIDLSRDEDSVQSLSALVTKDGLIAFAGINSSATQQQAGKNEHLKSFTVTYPKKDKEGSVTVDGKIILSGKSSLFTPSTDSKSRQYQRLLRLSPIRSRESSGKRLGAIATGDAAENEIILFNATTSQPDSSSICARLTPVDGAEAVDLDLLEPREGQFSMAYCTDRDVFVYKTTYDFTAKTSKPITSKPLKVYSVSISSKHTTQSKLRCLRWISPNNLLLLQKNPSGPAELLLLHMNHSDGSSHVMQRKRLSKSLEVAAHLDVCLLDADPATGECQLLLAVAGQDRSRQSTIHILVADFYPAEKDAMKQISKLQDFSVLSDVHPSNIMKLTFAPFFSPKQNPHSTMSIASSTQYARLASVAWGGTVVVETLALTSTPTKPSHTADNTEKSPAGPSVRWVLSTNSLTQRLMSWSGLVVLAFGILLTSILIHSYLTLSDPTSDASQIMREFQAPGAKPPHLRNTVKDHAISVDPDRIARTAKSLAGDAVPTAVVSEVARATQGLRDLLSARHTASQPHDQDTEASAHGHHHIFVSQGELGSEIVASVHQSAEALRAEGAKTFEELSEHERNLWKGRLTEAGEWSEGQGSAVLKGVLFSQWAQIVGGGIRDAILN